MDDAEISIEHLLANIFGGFPQALIGAMGLVITLLAFWLVFRTLRLQRGELATGRVVRWWTIRDNDGGTDHFAPVVSFTPRGAIEEIEVQPQHDFRKQPGEIGEFIQLRYDPANPERAETASAARQWFAVLCIFALGLGTLYTAWLIGTS